MFYCYFSYISAEEDTDIDRVYYSRLRFDYGKPIIPESSSGAEVNWLSVEPLISLGGGSGSASFACAANQNTANRSTLLTEKPNPISLATIDSVQAKDLLEEVLLLDHTAAKINLLTFHTLNEESYSHFIYIAPSIIALISWYYILPTSEEETTDYSI